jgi:hypothetical protein
MLELGQIRNGPFVRAVGRTTRASFAPDMVVKIALASHSPSMIGQSASLSAPV